MGDHHLGGAKKTAPCGVARKVGPGQRVGVMRSIAEPKLREKVVSKEGPILIPFWIVRLAQEDDGRLAQCRAFPRVFVAETTKTVNRSVNTLFFFFLLLLLVLREEKGD